MNKAKIGDLIWHLHHKVLLEVLNEPLENRIEYIKRQKPKNERETRLRLMRPLKEPLHHALQQARTTYRKAQVIRHKAQAYNDFQ